MCKDAQFNYTRARSTGYEWATSYLSGQTVNQSVLSWNGPVAGNRSVWDTLKFIFKGNEDTDFNVYRDLSDNLTGMYYEKFLIPIGLCQAFEGRLPGFMTISLPDSHMFIYNVHITDPAASTTFQLPYSLMSGDKIRIQPSETSSSTNFKIKITEESTQTDDGSCTDYPTPRHHSYADCIDAELQDKIVPSLGCMVPWMSEENPCSQPIPRLSQHDHIVNWLMNISVKAFGNIEYGSDTCLPPCTRMSIQVSQAQILSRDKVGDNTFSLAFLENIEIKRIVLAYDATSLLVEVGSCLGLWLGLSVVGMYDVCAGTVQMVAGIRHKGLL